MPLLGILTPAYIEWVLILFMIMAGTNFFFLYTLMTGKAVRGSGLSEFKFYLSLIGLAALAVTVSLVLQSPWSGSFSDTFRSAFFQVASLMTTTGFVTQDFEIWPPFTKILLVILMFIGGCAGSTGGGMKVIRILISWRFMTYQVAKAIRPGLIKTIKFYDQPVQEANLDEVLGVLHFIICEPGIFFHADGADGA